MAFLGTRFARRVRFPMGREPPQGAVTPRSLVPLPSGPGDREDEEARSPLTSADEKWYNTRVAHKATIVAWLATTRSCYGT